MESLFKEDVFPLNFSCSCVNIIFLAYPFPLSTSSYNNKLNKVVFPLPDGPIKPIHVSFIFLLLLSILQICNIYILLLLIL